MKTLPYLLLLCAIIALYLLSQQKPDIRYHEREYTQYADSINTVIDALTHSIRYKDSVIDSLTKQIKPVRAKRLNETDIQAVQSFKQLTKIDTGRMVSVPVQGVRVANADMSELLILRSVTELQTAKGKYQLQHIEAVTAKEAACIELVQVYRHDAKRPKVKWWYVVVLGVAVAM